MNQEVSRFIQVLSFWNCPNIWCRWKHVKRRSDWRPASLRLLGHSASGTVRWHSSPFKTRWWTEKETVKKNIQQYPTWYFLRSNMIFLQIQQDMSSETSQESFQISFQMFDHAVAYIFQLSPLSTNAKRPLLLLPGRKLVYLQLTCHTNKMMPLPKASKSSNSSQRLWASRTFDMAWKTSITIPSKSRWNKEENTAK